jgi:NADPH:quinone reductase-like Zn-dependent oxidoreductase
VDAVLALAGGDALEKCLSALRAGGRVAYPSGVEPVPKAREGITVTSYDALFGDQKVQWAQLNQAVEARKFEVPIAATFSLADAAAAHRRVAAGRVPGKVILIIR